MEELFVREGLDLVIDPVQQGLIPLGDCRGDGILAAEGRDSYRISRILQRIGDDFRVVIGPGSGIPVFQRVLRIRVGVILLKSDLRVVLDQVVLCSGAGNDDHLIICAELRQVSDHSAVGRNDAQRDVHVRQGKIDLFRAFRCDREVCQNDIDLACLKIFHPVRRLCGYIIDLQAEILSDPVSEVNVIALVLTVFIHISEGILVRKDADIDGSAFLDLVKGPVNSVLRLVAFGSCFRSGRSSTLRFRGTLRC